MHTLLQACPGGVVLKVEQVLCIPGQRSHPSVEVRTHEVGDGLKTVTPTFYKNKILSTQERIEDAYQFAVHMKNIFKNKSYIGCIAWHGTLYFSKILEEIRRI
jgi:hypothetical protein